MGYEYTVQGWCMLNRPVDLAAPLSTVGDVTFDQHRAPHHWARVTGERRDHVVFAAQAKWVGNYYVALMTAPLDTAGGGTGLITVTGEITCDGKDRVIAAHGGRALTLPIRRLYDARSRWNAVYLASHYMARDVEQLAAVDVGHLRPALAGRSTVHGWVQLPLESGPTEGRLASWMDRLAAEPTLGGGLASMRQYGEPYVLIGQDCVDAVVALAALTAELPGSYGMLYCGSPTDGGLWQVPVTYEAGRARVLPAVSLSAADEPDPGPARADAYEGLDSGLALCPVRAPGDLHAVYAAMRRALPADPVTVMDDTAGPFGYSFTAGPLTCDLTADDGRQFSADAVGWPFLLTATMRHEADPVRLRRLVRELAATLAAAGVDVGPNRMEADHRGDARPISEWETAGKEHHTVEFSHHARPPLGGVSVICPVRLP